MLGLKHNQNYLVEYDPQWSVQFEQEKARLERALAGLARGIEHYGSTSVPGLRAKPILDILVGVLPLDDWARCQAPLEVLGYDYAANAGVPGHYIFGRGRDTSERTHLVHVVEYEGESWRFCLEFRDVLRASPGLQQDYLAAKEAACAAAPEGRAKYNALKTPFFETLDLKNFR